MMSIVVLMYLLLVIAAAAAAEPGAAGVPAYGKHHPSKHYDAIVCGGGVSGLAAAHALRAAGAEVLVLEAQPRIGGRLQRMQVGRAGRTSGSVPGWIDLGGQWAGDTQTKTLAYARMLNISHFPMHISGKHVFLYDGRMTLHNRSWPSAPYKLDELRQDWPEFKITMQERDDVVNLWNKIEALAATIDPAKPWEAPNAHELDSMTIASWLEQNAETPVGRWWIDLIARNGIGNGAFGSDSASMLHLAWTQRVSPQRESPEAYLFDGAAAQFPLRLAALLPRKSVRTGEPVEWIRHSRTGVTVTTTKGHYAAKAVIVAMPPHLTGRIHYQPALPAIRDQLTQRAPMGALIKAFAIYNTPWWRSKGLSGLAIGNTKVVDFVADSSNPRPGSPGVLATFLSGEGAIKYGAQPLSVRRAAVLDDLAALLGPQAKSDLLEYQEGNWPDNPWAGGAYTSFLTPGTWTQYGKALREPIGRIFWAGTEVSTRWPGFIHGALEAGEEAAAAVLKVLKHHT